MMDVEQRICVVTVEVQVARSERYLHLGATAEAGPWKLRPATFVQAGGGGVGLATSKVAQPRNQFRLSSSFTPLPAGEHH